MLLVQQGDTLQRFQLLMALVHCVIQLVQHAQGEHMHPAQFVMAGHMPYGQARQSAEEYVLQLNIG